MRGFIPTWDLLRKIRGLSPKEQDRIVKEHEKKFRKVFWLVWLGGLAIMAAFIFLVLRLAS